MALEYTITELPAVWPGKKTVYPKKAPFKTQWSRTLHLLEREIRHLGGKKVEFALALRGHWDLRQDGQLRADARPGPAVIVSFLDSDGQRQAYPCDRFGWWQDNLYAIAVVLEDLRRAERYGVQSSLIRAGFKALPATTQPALSTEAAALVIATRMAETAVDGQPTSVGRILSDSAYARDCVRVAAARVHPDRGGTTTDFQLVQEAKRVLAAHHGTLL